MGAVAKICFAKILTAPQPLPRFFVQPDEKSYIAIRTPKLCGIAFILLLSYQKNALLSTTYHAAKAAIHVPCTIHYAVNSCCAGNHSFLYQTFPLSLTFERFSIVKFGNELTCGHELLTHE